MSVDYDFWCGLLLTCALINYAILMLWFVVVIFAHDWLRQLHGRWFKLSDAQVLMPFIMAAWRSIKLGYCY